MYRDVYPVAHQPEGNDLNRIVDDLLRLLWKKGHIKNNDRVIVTMGDTMGYQGGTNTLRLIQLGPDGYTEDQTALDFS